MAGGYSVQSAGSPQIICLGSITNAGLSNPAGGAETEVIRLNDIIPSGFFNTVGNKIKIKISGYLQTPCTNKVINIYLDPDTENFQAANLTLPDAIANNPSYIIDCEISRPSADEAISSMVSIIFDSSQQVYGQMSFNNATFADPNRTLTIKVTLAGTNASGVVIDKWNIYTETM